MLTRANVSAATLALLTLPLAPAPAHAAGSTPTWSVTASFTQPATDMDQATNVRWSATSETLHQRHVGKPLTLRITSSAPLDCHHIQTSLSATTPMTCSGTTATISFTATRAMIGRPITITGWATTPGLTADLQATATVNKKTTTVSATATRTAEQMPIGPLQPIGTWHDKPIAIASAGDQHQLWIDGSPISAPAGAITHTKLIADRIALWYPNTEAQGHTVWRYNFTTMTIDELVAAYSTKILAQSPLALLTEGPGENILYTWDGDVVDRLDAASHIGVRRFVGFTRDGYLTSEEFPDLDDGGAGNYSITLHSLTDSRTRALEWTTTFTSLPALTIDDTGVTLNGPSATGPTTCRLTLDATSCSGV